jgi:hypothetical protein
MTPREQEMQDRHVARFATVEAVRACCKTPENLRTVEVRADRFETLCFSCGRKHYRMLADPGRYPLLRRIE